jgi:TRAP-type transport system periplasmic protein
MSRSRIEKPASSRSRTAWLRAGAIGAVIGLMASVPLRADSPITIKFATLAPEGTGWVRAIQRANRELQEATSGAVLFKLYAGGVLGDERDVIRKMRLGQIQAAGVGGAGMSEVVPEVHVLHLPFLFESGGEVDYVLEQLFPEFQRKFEEKGFRLLGFTETGFSYLFSKLPLASPADLRASDVKAWVWAGDALHQAVYEAYRMPSVPLALTDVLTGLQAGKINTVYCPPTIAVAMQWHTKVGYVTSMPVGWSSGATLLTEKTWQGLSPGQQQILAEITGGLSRNLIALTRQDNLKALEMMKKLGIRATRAPTDEEMAEFKKVSVELRRSLVGKLYPQQLLDRVEGLIQEYRSEHPAGGASQD